MKLYIMVIENDRPVAVKPLEHVGTVSIMGQEYWLVPNAELTQPVPGEALIAHAPDAVDAEKTIEQQVQDLVVAGGHSIERIARMVRISPHMVNLIIKTNNLETPATRIRRRFRTALNAAGDEGLSPSDLSGLAGPEHRNSTGPVLAAMMRHGEVKRLEGGRWMRTART